MYWQFGPSEAELQVDHAFSKAEGTKPMSPHQSDTVC